MRSSLPFRINLTLSFRWISVVLLLNLSSCSTFLSENNTSNLHSTLYNQETGLPVKNGSPIGPGKFTLVVAPVDNNGNVVRDVDLASLTCKSPNGLFLSNGRTHNGFLLEAQSPLLADILSERQYDLEVGIKGSFNRTDSMTFPILLDKVRLENIRIAPHSGLSGKQGDQYFKDGGVGENGSDSRSTEVVVGEVDVSEMAKDPSRPFKFLILLVLTGDSCKCYYGSVLPSDSKYLKAQISVSGGAGGSGGTGSVGGTGGQAGAGGNAGDIKFETTDKAIADLFNIESNGGRGGSGGVDGPVKDGDFVSGIAKTLSNNWKKPNGSDGISGDVEVVTVSLDELKKKFATFLGAKVAEKIRG